MKVIKHALGAKATGDATLMSLLGGEHVYQASPEIVTADLTAWITYWCVSRNEQTEIQRLDQSYQFDVWAVSADTADAIAERLSTVFGWRPDTGGGTLTIVGRRLAEPVYEEPTSPEIGEPTSAAQQLHHRTKQFRISTYPMP